MPLVTLMGWLTFFYFFLLKDVSSLTGSQQLVWVTAPNLEESSRGKRPRSDSPWDTQENTKEGPRTRASPASFPLSLTEHSPKPSRHLEGKISSIQYFFGRFLQDKKSPALVGNFAENLM